MHALPPDNGEPRNPESFEVSAGTGDNRGKGKKATLSHVKVP